MDRRFVALVILLFLSSEAGGDELEAPLAGVRSGFGFSEVYRGQVFTTPAAQLIVNKLTVFVGPTVDANASFRVLITEFNSDSGFSIGDVLFESESLTVPILPLRREPDAFDVELMGLRLDANREYAWIIDHFVEASGNFVSMGTGTAGPYPGGFAFRFPNGPFLPPGTRSDHFGGGGWFIDAEADFAFSLEFTPEASPAQELVPFPKWAIVATAGLLLSLGICTPRNANETARRSL